MAAASDRGRASARGSAALGRAGSRRRARTARRQRRPDAAPAPRRQRPRSVPASNGPVKVVASKANNSLLIRATPADYERVEATLARLDTAPWQVLIEATIAEVTLNDQLRYGVQYFLESGSFAGGFNSAGTARCASNAAVERTLPGLQLPVHPWRQQHHHRRPVAADQRQGPVRAVRGRAGQQRGGPHRRRGGAGPDPAAAEHAARPIANSSTASSIATPASSCRCGRASTPTRPSRSRSRRRSAACNSHPAPPRTRSRPTFTQRKITSRVNVQSGQTVVLGGLIQDSEESGRDRIPVLGEIPVLGNLFGTTNNRNTAHRADRVHHPAGDPQPRGRARRQRGAALAPATRCRRRSGRRPWWPRPTCRRPGQRPPADPAASPDARSGPRRALTAWRRAGQRSGGRRWPELTGPRPGRAARRSCVGSFVGTLVLRAPDGWRGMWLGPLALPRLRRHAASARDLVPLVELAREPRAAAAIAALRSAHTIRWSRSAPRSSARWRLAWLSGPAAWLAAVLGWWLLALALIDLRSLAACRTC